MHDWLRGWLATMSGIFGLFDLAGACDFKSLAHRLSPYRAPLAADQTVELVCHDRFLVGRFHLKTFSQPAIAPMDAGDPLVLTAGYLVDDHQDVVPGMAGWSAENTVKVRRLLDNADDHRMKDLNGSFQFALVDRERHRVRILNDRFGFLPLFVYRCASLFAFAPDVSLLLDLIDASAHARGDHAAVLDRESLAEWFEIGFVMGDRTLLRDITVLPAASLLIWENGNIRLRSYWEPRFSVDGSRFEPRVLATELDRAIRRSVRRRIPRGARVSVSLSGGLDSRLLLAAAAAEHLPVAALTFGPHGSDDHSIAARVAEHLGMTHHRFMDTPHEAAAVFSAGVRRTAGMSNICDFWGLQHGAAIRQDNDIMINGIGGNELLGFVAFDLLRFLAPYGETAFNRWLAHKLNPGWPPDTLRRIRHGLAPGLVPFAQRMASYRYTGNVPPAFVRVYDFFLREKSRRGNLLGLMTDDLFVEPVAPFLDNDVVDLALRIPPRQKLLARFYRRFLSRYYPSVAGFTYNRTGLPANASTARLAAKKLHGRLVPHKPDTAGGWSRWLRNDLRDYVCDHLLSTRPLIADVIDARIVHSTVEQFLSTPSVPATVVGQLLTCELFLREFRPQMQ